MKKLFIAFLCLLLIAFCACKQATSPEETTTVMISSEKTYESTTEEATTEKTTAGKDATNRYGQPVVEIKTSEDDPYSYEVKRLNDELNNNQSGYYSSTFFALYDLNGNGAKELLLGDGDSDAILKILTIRNGVAVWQEEYKVNDIDEFDVSTMVFKNGTIRVKSERGVRYITYYRFENGELKRQMTLESNREGYFRSKRLEFNFIPITKDEFNRAQKEFEGDGQTVELDWKPLAEYGG